MENEQIYSSDHRYDTYLLWWAMLCHPSAALPPDHSCYDFPDLQPTEEEEEEEFCSSDPYKLEKEQLGHYKATSWENRWCLANHQFQSRSQVFN